MRLARLICIDAWDPVAAASVTMRASSIDDDRVCHLDGATWLPAIFRLPSISADYFDGSFEGQIASPRDSLQLAVAAWPSFPRFLLTDARIRLWEGVTGAAWGSYSLKVDGRVLSQPTIAEGLATLEIGVDDRWLDAPLLSTYAGTTGLEGDAGLKGKVKPLALGAPRFVPGELIDSANSVFQLSAYGVIEGVEHAFEKLVRFGSSTGDYANLAALIAAAIPPGGWGTCLAQGLVRHGAPPAGKMCWHVRGDKAGPDGWVRLPGSIIKRIALIAGGSGKIDDASMTALNSSRPWQLSIYQAEQTTARTLIQRIAASVNAVAGVNWLGQLCVDPVGFGTPTQTLDEAGASLPAVATVEQAAIDPPFWRLAIGALPTWAVHDIGSDVSFTAPIVPRGRYSATETYREGHWVDLADGSQWLYINATPSSGNAPPTSGTSNSWWSRVSPPTGLADIGYNGDPDATRNDDGANMLRAPIGLERALVGGPAIVFIDPTATGRPGDRHQIKLTGANGKAYWDEDPIPVTPGETLWYAHQAKTDISGGTDTCHAGFDCYGADGVQLSGGAGSVSLASTTTLDGTDSIAAFKHIVTSFMVPSGVAFILPFVTRPNDGTPGATFIIGEPYLGRGQPGADITLQSQVLVSVDTVIPVQATYTGSVAALLPFYIVPVVSKGGVNIQTLDSTTYSISTAGLTATINNTNGSSDKGIIEITAFPSNSGSITLNVTVDGVALSPIKITLFKLFASPPNGGGGGAKMASDSSLNDLTSTSFAAITDVLTVTLASGESLYGTAPLQYYVDGLTGASSAVTAKWQYSPAGAGSWTDFATAIAGSASTGKADLRDELIFGFGDFTQSKGGLSAGDYDVRLMGALDLSGETVVFTSGTATIEAKV